MRRWRSQRPSRNTSTSRSQQCSGTVPVPGCIPNEMPEGRLGRVQTQAGPAGSGSGGRPNRRTMPEWPSRSELLLAKDPHLRARADHPSGVDDAQEREKVDSACEKTDGQVIAQARYRACPRRHPLDRPRRVRGCQRCCMDRGGDGIRPFPSGSVRRCVRTQAVRVRSLCSELSGRP